MTQTWQHLAARRRPAEDRLIRRYRDAFFKGDAPAEGRGYSTVLTPWGRAREFFPGMSVLDITQRSAWPETQIVFDLALAFGSRRHAVAIWPMWPGDSWREEEPPYNDVLGINIGEAVQKRYTARAAEQRGPVLYFIWAPTADLANPPAPGEPPSALLSAREELQQIRSQIALTS